jgi:two-component system cell cycle response regulator
VLREFATRIRRDTRGIDLACRLGSEEFVVVMPDCDLAKAYQVGERLRQCIAAAAFEVGGKVGLLQVAALEFDDDAPEQMLKRADEALYCAKRDGRNRVVADAA